ncbi:N-acetyltransferase [Rhodococcus sp. ACPA1]|nr:N-acetyltransferase [Rhodococcus sp. ACPA1]
MARALVGRLLDDVRREGFVTVRLESLRFMTAAHALYRSQGFMETPPFAGSEAGSAGLVSGAVFMELVQRYVLTRLVAVIGAHG